MALPAGLGGAIAITERRLGLEERSGDCFLSKNWREMLEFEDKLIGEAKRVEELLTLALLLLLALYFEERGREELRLKWVEIEEAIIKEKEEGKGGRERG